MSEATSKYYELDKIKPYRFIAIDRAVKQFKKRFNIKHLPIDCVQLAIKLNKEIGSNIKIQSTLDLPDKVLGRTLYIGLAELYLVSINLNQLYDAMKKRTKYPFVYSSDRMLNFTLAHEFGHIFIGHAEIPDEDKDDELKAEEDLEANEFAGRLLMPKASMENCNFSTLGEVAAEYLVSEQAVLKRLTHLKRHDKRSAKPTEVCPNCWNPNIESYFNYCSVCGVPLTDKKGVFTMHYTDGYKMDQYGRAIPCPRCGNSHYEDEDICCRNCGLYLINDCTNGYCYVTHLNDGSSRYCYNCGAQSTFLAYGILNDWKPAKESILSIQELEEDICGIGCSPELIYDWGYLIDQLSASYSGYLSESLEGSEAKYYGEKLLIYVKEKDTKDRLNQDKYRSLIITAARNHLNVNINEVHIISFEEHLPKPDTIEFDDIPF